MESLTKTKLNARQMKALIAAAFGEDAGIARYAELTNGWFNAAYEIELTDGRAVILKVAPDSGAETLAYEKDIMRTEVEAMRRMRAAGGVPVPEVFAYDDSRMLIGTAYFVMEKVAGQPYNMIKEDMTQEQRAAIETAIGRFNRRINEIRGERFGFFHGADPAATASWPAAFGAMMRALLADGRRLGVQLPAPYASIEAEVERRLPLLAEVTEPRLVHWDLWSGNVLVADGRIAGIIDWERALWGDPLMEYYFRRFERSEAFYSGYGGRFDLPNEQVRKRLYDLYLDLILVIECYVRKYENEDHVRWAHDNAVQGWAKFMDGTAVAP
ncbi:phosphotransferase family protein [Cohnella nanjingensis]|uniref:Aminoglycoside phosphotransferase family protein n=1 Tax=Cohnella nanjingensis TaxID=1387779 RepID=A0A7X0RNB1_9BACL|nr:aminoglycoside phosphotransferase family protein [Cohnella nanjingensis]MBB6670536.1 aminoglycoside phosphotransferase family protein [Cohnella nanjingensis]